MESSRTNKKSFISPLFLFIYKETAKHLYISTSKQGLKVIKHMEQTERKQVIIFSERDMYVHDWNDRVLIEPLENDGVLKDGFYKSYAGNMVIFELVEYD